MPLRILVLCWTYPRPDFNAGDRRFVFMLEMLARSHRVDYVVPHAGRGMLTPEGEAVLRSIGVNVLGVGWDVLMRALMRTRYHVVLGEYFTVLANYTDIIRQRQPDAQIMVDTVDLHFIREQAAARQGLISEATAAQTQVNELAVYRSCDVVIAASAEDAAILERQSGMRRVSLIPIIMPLRARPPVDRRREVLFVGGFRHLPNIDGIKWFVTDVWPLVTAEIPDATLAIVGSHPPPEIAALAAVGGVDVLGYVPDTEPFLDRCRVSIAPLRFGAGMKGKVVEALASAVPVVTTPIGVQGIPAISGRHLEIAEDAKEFAKAVIRLLRDPQSAEAMGHEGQELARMFTPEQIEGEMDQLLSAAVRQPRSLMADARWATATAFYVVRKVPELIFRNFRPSSIK